MLFLICLTIFKPDVVVWINSFLNNSAVITLSEEFWNVTLFAFNSAFLVESLIFFNDDKNLDSKVETLNINSFLTDVPSIDTVILISFATLRNLILSLLRDTSSLWSLEIV